MNSKVAQELWDKVLREYCHCYTDDVGNRPCDNGCLCDRCLADDVQQIYKSELEAATSK